MHAAKFILANKSVSVGVCSMKLVTNFGKGGGRVARGANSSTATSCHGVSMCV